MSADPRITEIRDALTAAVTPHGGSQPFDAALAALVSVEADLAARERGALLAGSELDWLIGYLTETDEHAAVHARRARAALAGDAAALERIGQEDAPQSSEPVGADAPTSSEESGSVEDREGKPDGGASEGASTPTGTRGPVAPPGAPPDDPHDWHREITMPGDDTQTLADVLVLLRTNHLQGCAAFVEWLADDWYGARQEIAEADFARRSVPLP